MRPDRKEALRSRSINQETVVKSTLLKYLNGDKKQQIVDAIKKRVISYSKAINRCSIVMSGILKELFDNKDIVNVEIPDIFDETYINQCSLGLDKSRREIKTISNYFDDHPECKIKINRYNFDTNIYSYGSKIYSTNIKNHLKLNLLNKIKQFSKKYQQKEGLPQDSFKEINDSIIGKRSSNIDIVNEVRTILGLEEDNVINQDWLSEKNNLIYIIRFFVFLNRYYEANELKTFNIIPMNKIKCHNITIDNQVLLGILKDCDIVDKKLSVIKFKSIATDWFKSIFKINKLQGQHNEFSNMINTDGISMSMHFKRPKNTQDSSFTLKGRKRKYIVNNDDIKMLDDDRVVAIDPGRTNIIYGVDTDDNKYKLTRNQYYTDSGIFKARKNTQRWNDGIKDTINSLSNVSTKGVSVERHREYVNVFLKHYDVLWEEYTKARWGRQRFSLYSGKQKVIQKKINEIKNSNREKRVIIAYGSVTVAAGGKGELSVPVSKIFKKITQNFIVKLIDEYRTSKVYWKTDEILKSVATQVDGKTRSVRGLFWSSTKNELVNRDFNGAKNILRCATSELRPASLTRSQCSEKIKMKIGKYV